MFSNDPSIVWPAPGFPAFLEPHDRHLDCIVASRDAGPHALRAWMHGIALRDHSGTCSIPLEVTDLAPAERNLVAERAGQFAALPQARDVHFVRARLQVPSFNGHSSRSFRLFDLSVGDRVERARSVAVLGDRKRVLNLAFASDLHVAKVWDEIAAAVDRHTPEFSDLLVSPNRLLDRFIDEANALAVTGDLDLVVLGGDLVDHVHTHPRASQTNGNGATNVSLLMTTLARLEVPTLTIPGNHDYRSFPWRPRSRGFAAVGIPWTKRKHLLRKAGLWDCWPLCRQDIDALRTTDEAGVAALSDYLVRVNPATEFCCSLRGLRLLFTSTGSDILGKWHELERARWGLLLRGLHTLVHPNSEGFSEGQLARIRTALQQGGSTALFFHAPLLATRGNVGIQERLARLDPGRQDSIAARVRFERRLQRAGFRCGVSFRNPGVVLQELAAAAGPVVTFSGHAHRADAIEIDRRTKQVRSIDPNQAAARPDTIKLLTAPAVGHLESGVRQGPPGHLLARFGDGALVSLEQRALCPV
jgi:hypothetical protein